MLKIMIKIENVIKHCELTSLEPIKITFKLKVLFHYRRAGILEEFVVIMISDGLHYHFL
jgi:hypothetical protein